MTDQAQAARPADIHGNCAYSEGRIPSGDVSLFYRRFGTPGKTPLLIMHGVNYFDSFDWIGVASKLATDREVVAFDHRGFGESTWSPSKDYSIDTKFMDIQNVMKALGWVRPIVLGHSGSGRLSVSFAAAFPELLSRLIVVDSNFDNGELQPAGVGKKSKVYPSVEAAMAHYAEFENPPRMGLDRRRTEQALVKVDGGYRIKMDPDYGNVVPTNGDTSVRPIRELPAWEQLPKVKCPFLMVQGLKSSRWTPELVAKLKATFPNIQWATADSMHDIPYYAPDELVAGVRKFIADI